MSILKKSFILNANKEYIVLNLVKGILWEGKDINNMFLEKVNHCDEQNIGIEIDINKEQIEKFLKEYIEKICDDNKEFTKFINEIKDHHINCRTFKKMLECEGLDDSCIKTKNDLQEFIRKNILKKL